MNIHTHILHNIKIAEILSDAILVHTTEDGLNLLGNVYYQDFDKIIINEAHLTPAFFDLKNGMAGEILQKFSNYRVRLAIVGDFTKHTSRSIRDFMYESNKVGHINFVNSQAEAIKVLSEK